MTQKAFDWLDSQLPAITSDLETLAGMNSGSSNLDGLTQVAGWLAENMVFPDAELELLDLPSVEQIDDLGSSLESSTGQAMAWHCRKAAPRRVLLAIHYDTVFGVDHAFQDCTSLSPTRLQGPGVADAKGGILTIRAAVQAIEKFGLAADCGWTILLNPDEEIGSPHSTPLMDRMAAGYDFGLLFEPSLPGGELVSTRGGSGNYTVVVRGRAAHVGRHFADGRNAIARLSWLFSQLDALNTQTGLTLNVGFVRGGGPVNVVPDLAVGRFNIRVADADVLPWFEAQFRQLCEQIEATDGYSVQTSGGVSSPPKIRTEPMSRLMSAIEAACPQVGLAPPRWISTGGVCDGNKLAAAGLPNIDTLGPVGGGLHSDSEWVELPSIVQKAKLVAEIIKRFSSAEFSVK